MPKRTHPTPAPTPRSSPSRRGSAEPRWSYERAWEFNAQADVALKTGRAALALRLGERAMQAWPGDARLFSNHACRLWELGDVDGATRVMTLAAACIEAEGALLDAEDATLLAVVGTAVCRVDEKRGWRLLRRAVELDGGCAVAHYNLACALADKDLNEDALPHFQRSFELNPDDPCAAGGLMGAYMRAGLFFEAMDLGEASMKRWPEAADLRFNLGLCYLDHGRASDATEVFLEHLRAFPDDACGHGLCGVAYAVRGWREEARGEQEAARRLGGGRPEVERLVDEIEELLDDGPGEQTEPAALRELALILALVWAGQRGRRGSSPQA